MLYLCPRLINKRGHLYMDNSVQNTIKQSIIRRGRGKFVFLQDFSVYGSRDAVKKAFQRLANENFILRIANGIYYYPQIDKVLGLGVIKPSLDDVAQAIAKRDRVKIIPSGTYALNMLGLSTQVATNAVYYTNGTARRIHIGDGKGILFIHTNDNKMLSFKSRLMMLIVSAMREIGEHGFTEEYKSQIKPFVENVSKTDFEHDITLAPVWVRNILLTL